VLQDIVEGAYNAISPKELFHTFIYVIAPTAETAKIAQLRDLTSKLISVTEASRISGFTPVFIRLLIRRGEIEGVKIGRNWLTTREAVDVYLKKERHPGPKPKSVSGKRR
jgi:excisionase family DNA binding protein